MSAQAKDGGNPWFNLKLIEQPWYIGVYGGYANNAIYQGGAENSRPGKIWENGHGFIAAIPARFQIFNWLALQMEAVFITKNYQYYYHSFGHRPYNETTNIFIDFPVLVNLSIRPAGVRGLRLFVNGGVFLGLWAASHEKGENRTAASDKPIYRYNGWYQFDKRRDNRFDYGLAAGLGVQYDIRWFGVSTEWRYYHSLSDLQKAYQYNLPPQMNSTWTIQFGILINPGKIGGGK
ncbi:MAG: PorT family protein [Treponema sp.]|nr:PorT family protein [Treponema sp.]